MLTHFEREGGHAILRALGEMEIQFSMQDVRAAQARRRLGQHDGD
jgi:hypothetical protein